MTDGNGAHGLLSTQLMRRASLILSLTLMYPMKINLVQIVISLELEFFQSSAQSLHDFELYCLLGGDL